MIEIKPVYEARQFIETKFAISEAPWQEVSFEKYQELLNVSIVQTRVLYPAAALETLQAENAGQKKLIESLHKQVETAVSRISDMLESDDGQAHKEARKFIESLPAPEYQELESKGG